MFIQMKNTFKIAAEFFGGLGSTISNTLGPVLGELVKGVNSSLDKLATSLNNFSRKTEPVKLTTVAAAIGLLAASIYVLSRITDGQLITAGKALGALGVGLVVIAKSIDILNVQSFKGTAASMILMSVALLILSTVVKKLSALDPTTLVPAIVAIGVLLAEMTVAASKISKNATKFVGASISMILLADCVNIISKAVGRLGALDFGTLVKGLVGITLILGGLTKFAEEAGKNKFGISAGLGVLAISSSLVIMAGAMAVLSLLPWPTLVKGMAAIAMGLAPIAIAIKIMGDNSKNLLAVGAGLIGVSLGMILISAAVLALGSMDFLGTVVPGVAAVAATVLAIAAAVRLMGSGTSDMLKVGTGILLIAAALLVLAVPITLFGTLPIPVLAAGLISLAVAIGIFGIAAFAFGKLNIDTVLLNVGKAMALFGVGLLALAAAIILFTPVSLALPVIFSSMAIGIIAALSILLQGIMMLGSQIALTLSVVIKAICLSIRSSAEDIAGAIVVVITIILQALASKSEAIFTAILNIIKGLIIAIGKQIRPLADAAVKLMAGFIDGLGDGIRNNTGKLKSAIGNLISSILEFVLSALQSLLGDIPVIGEKIDSALEKVDYETSSLPKMVERWEKSMLKLLVMELPRRKAF